MTMTKRLVRSIKDERADAANTMAALRLQARAWRNVAMISLTDRETAMQQSRWLLFSSVPFVNGPALEKFVAETQPVAEASAVSSGCLVGESAS